MAASEGEAGAAAGGKAAPTTRIAYSTTDRIVVDGADLVEDLIGQVSFKVPRGVAPPWLALCSASSRSARSCTQRSWNAVPASVSERRRVVRFSRRASRCASSSAT